MVDTPEQIQKQTEANDALAKSLENVTNEEKRLGEESTRTSNILGITQSIMNGIKDVANRAGTALREMGRSTSDQSLKFALLTTSVLKVREAFTGLAGIDQSGFTTFGQNLDRIRDMLLSGETAASKATTAMESLIGIARHAGATESQITAARQKGADAVWALAKNSLAAADNALRLQNAIIQLSGRTGTLNELFAAGGTRLRDINAVLARHQEMVGETASATGLLTEDVEKYWAQLGTIPGVLQQNIRLGDALGQNMGMLAATIQLARGAGRSFADVVKDMGEAFELYGVTGEPALLFTARMGEVANKFHIQLEDVRSALMETAETFKFFGNESEGAAALLSRFLGAMQNTGLGAKPIIEIYRNFTGQINQLSLAQKAFLSAQTGGPGGLMGAFQIENMLRSPTGLLEVFNRVRQTMQRQFGSVVTLEEASRSPAAAAQMTRQIALMRQGPLGQFAQTDQQAIRLLEAFPKLQQGQISAEELSRTVLKDTIDRGQDIQDKSYSELTRIRTILERSTGAAGVPILGGIQRFGLTAGVGEEIEGGDVAAEARENLRRHSERATAATGKVALNMQAKNLTDMRKEYSEQIVDEYGRFFQEAGTAFETFFQQIQKIMGRGGLSSRGLTGTIPTGVDPGQFSTYAGYEQATRRKAGAQVGTAAAGVAERPMPTTTTPTGGFSPTTATTTAAPATGGAITIHNVIEGYCLNCGVEMMGNEQTISTAPQGRARK